MPELPDLAVMAINLERKLKDKTLKALTLHVDRKNNVPESKLQSALVGHKINSVSRAGKELRLFIGKESLGLHLMLHGELKFIKTGDEVKFPILQLDFVGESLYMTDWQKQATPTLNPEVSNVPDALDIDQTIFSELLTKKKTDIKTLLLDQKSIRGIGNAYADEILYDAGISPHSISNAIPSKLVEVLLNSIKAVLTDAVKKISKSNPGQLTGENREFMKIHLPKTEKTVKGETIIVDKKGARKSYYVDSQKVFK